MVKSIASKKTPREFAIYWLILGLSGLTLFSAYGLLRSKVGLALTAIGERQFDQKPSGPPATATGAARRRLYGIAMMESLQII